MLKQNELARQFIVHNISTKFRLFPFGSSRDETYKWTDIHYFSFICSFLCTVHVTRSV